MLTSIATVSIGGALGDKLPVIAKAGFAGVEICEADFIAFDGSADEVRMLLSDLGLRCVAYQPLTDFEGLSGARRQRAFDRAELKLDLARRLGADLLLVSSTTALDADGDHARIVADLRALGERAAERGLRIAYQAQAWGRHVSDHRDAWAIVVAAAHPAVGLALNSFHSLAKSIPIDSILTIDPKRIFLVQLADAPRLEMNLFQWSRHYSNMPGQGDLAVGAYVAELMRIGYEGPLSLEIFNDRFRAGSANVVARDGRRALLATCDAAERLLGCQPRLPALTAVHGVAFVEIAASPEEAAQIEAMLGSLGFRLVGRHRNKAVNRWRQGDVNIVINSQPNSFAQSYYLNYGASVCAIGLLVDNVARARARARALGIDDFEEKADHGNLRLPAVRGVGGSLVYLIAANEVEALWDHEFERLSEEVEGFGLRRFDHLAATIAHEEFQSWLLYWTALFGLRKTARQDIFDPSGVVQSQVVESADGAFRMTLNGTDTGRTQAAHFLENALGGGIQHLALATDDIFATADALVAAGADILSIPRNYFDDLAARFALDATLVDRLAARNILYDEDSRGNVFFQLYTAAFDRRFFFEIVQRDSYEGYGAANTHVRLTVQSRSSDLSVLL